MKLVTFSLENSDVMRLGALLDASKLLDLARAEELAMGGLVSCFGSMQALIDSGERGLDAARERVHRPVSEAVIERSSVTLRAPLPVPARLRDSGMFIEHYEIVARYMAKVMTANAPDPEAAYQSVISSDSLRIPEVAVRRAIYYTGNHHSVIGPNAPLVWPYDCNVIDYELELGFVIGRAGFNLEPDDVHAHIFGYTLFNDWSARDLQMDTMGARMGPSMGKDFANSLGPCIVTPDEIADLYALEMTASVNGEVWSRGYTRNIHHTLNDTIAQFSRISALVPGEVIGSGTPANGSGTEQGKFLKVGDTVTLSLVEIGSLSNTIVAAP